jgi:hypothetical protein
MKKEVAVLEQTTRGRDQDTWHTLMEKPLSGFNGEAPAQVL